MSSRANLTRRRGGAEDVLERKASRKVRKVRKVLKNKASREREPPGKSHAKFAKLSIGGRFANYSLLTYHY